MRIIFTTSSTQWLTHTVIHSISLLKKDCYGESLTSHIIPLHLACLYNAPWEVIESLIIAFPEGVKDKDTLFQRLPLHVACEQNASYQIIRTLITYYPQGCKTRDTLGRLPLHYACFTNVTLDVIDMLLVDYPNGVKCVDGKGWLPLHISVKYNTNVDVSRKLLLMFPDGKNLKTLKGCTPFMCANTSKLENKEEFVSMLDDDENDIKTVFESNPCNVVDYFSQNDRIHVGGALCSKNRLNW